MTPFLALLPAYALSMSTAFDHSDWLSISYRYCPFQTLQIRNSSEDGRKQHTISPLLISPQFTL
jgi:hypothetical protein